MSAQVLLQASWLSATSVPDSSGAGTLEDLSISPCCQSVPSEPSLRCLLISASAALLLQSPAVSMAPKVAVQNIKVWIVTLGGSVQDDEERLVVSVRQRLNRHFAQLNVEKVAAAAFAYGLEPVVQYMENALPALKVQAYSPKELAENAFDAFKIIAARTRLTRKWAQVIDSASAWALVEGSLTEVANGRTLQAPALVDGSMPTGGSYLPAEPLAPWWAHRWVVAAAIEALAALLFQLRSFLTYGRNRVTATLGSGLWAALGVYYLRYGPDELPQTFWIRWAKYDEAVEVADDELSEAPSASDDGEARLPTLPPPSESEQPAENVEVLRSEMRDGMAQMRSLIENLVGAPQPQGVPSGGAEAGPAVPAPGSVTEPMQALANFVGNRPVDGPLSLTAQRMASEAASAAAGLPQVSPEEAAAAAAGIPQLYPEPPPGLTAPGTASGPVGSPVRPIAAPQQAMSPGAVPFPCLSPERSGQPGAGWAPFAGAQRCITQAQSIKRLLVEKEATRSVNPFWANAFWQDVSAFELAEGPLEPDLRRLLIAGGYVGPGTVGAPRAALKAQLDSVILTGAPQHGAGAQTALEPGWLVRAVPDAVQAVPAGWAESAICAPALGDMVRWEDQLAPDLPRPLPRSSEAAVLLDRPTSEIGSTGTTRGRRTKTTRSGRTCGTPLRRSTLRSLDAHRRQS